MINNERRIIVMGGSFNPPTIAHQRLLLHIVEALKGEKGIFVPSSHEYVTKKISKTDYPTEVLGEDTRLQMLRAMCCDDKRLEVDDLEFYRTEKAYTYETLEDIQKKYPWATVYFLAGGDKVSIIEKWHRIDELLENFKIIVVKRGGDDPEIEIYNNEKLRQYRDRFVVLSAPNGIDEISSSAVRKMIRNNKEGAKLMVHPEVWKIICNIWKSKMKVKTFRGEYYFLSNFYEAPVEYKGLKYSNNEAAFQAQKCLKEEEKHDFTSLDPESAKIKGREIPLRTDWEEVKLEIMEEIVRAKFTQNEELTKKLLETDDMILEEGNTWNDTFWGICLNSGIGKNNLGIILMKIREELKK